MTVRRHPSTVTRILIAILVFAVIGTMGFVALNSNNGDSTPTLDPSAAAATPDPSASPVPAPAPTINTYDGLDAVSIAADVYHQENGVYPPTREDLQATLPDLLDTVEYTPGEDTFCAQITDGDVTVSLTAGQEATEGPCPSADQPAS